MILAGDIGGTKTGLALYAYEGTRLRRSAMAAFPSHDFPGLCDVISSFLLSPRPPITAAGFGVAGPVIEGRVKTTNLPWVVDGPEVARFLGLTSVTLLNDLEAMAWGIETLEPEDFLVLQEGARTGRGNAAVIAAGTGLGEALLLREGARFVPVATEGGHADFAPNDGEADALLAWLRARHGHVSAERIVSGLGLASLYEFFHDPARGVPRHLDGEPDVPAALARAAAAGACPACERAFALFLRAYGAEAGNLTLKAGATAGLFVGGGIARKNPEMMADGRFIEAFRQKGRFRSYMERIPVKLILSDAAPLNGAALSASRTASGML